MKRFFLQVLTWWNGQTLGTRLWTWRKGRLVGKDEFGNAYYRTHDGKRRWVIYNGEAEASLSTPNWHGWLHYRTDITPVGGDHAAHDWERPYRPNLTGTGGAYRPPGSLARLNPHSVNDDDYQAWRPEHSEIRRQTRA
ncbi:MAG: NADH:ubiquinone oxidoreductase subunit NDUFA12 [Hyphomicrobiales bacterium]